MENLVGEKFNKWTVVSYWGRKGGNYYWNCQCECGNKKVVDLSSLKRSKSKSCGCHKSKKLRERVLVHGNSVKGKTTKEFRSWQDMKDRCYNEKNDSFNNYGGRGIKVCKRWINSFQNFLDDMGKCPSGYTLDRINNNGDYEPSNCRWVSRSYQVKNRRNNKRFLYNGEWMIIKDISKKSGIPYQTLRHRLLKMKLPLDKALEYQR